MSNELTNTENAQVATVNPESEMLGLEEADSKDIVIPRLKLIQALSPERKDKIADEGDIINDLTKEKITPDDIFIPIKVYYSNIKWNPQRDAEDRMQCRSLDGKRGEALDGTIKSCRSCGCDKFDNTKKGKEAQPTCTAYLNFLGFFKNNPMPVVLSFSRTNYNEGKKMLSIARSLMVNIWSYGYKLTSKEISKNGNSWYIIVPALAGKTEEADKVMAKGLFDVYQKKALSVDYEETQSSKPVIDEATAEEI